MIIRKTLFATILLGALSSMNSVFAQSVYPLHAECAPSDGYEFVCPWFPDTNFEAINLWLRNNEGIDIRDWVLDVDADSWATDLAPYSGSDPRTDRYRISDQTAQDYAVMLHFGTPRGGSCGIAFLYESERSYYAALVTGDQFSIDQRFGGTALPISNSSIAVPVEDLGSATGAQLLIIVQDDDYIFFVNGYRATEFTFHPDHFGQNLAIMSTGEWCDVSLSWMAMPAQASVSPMPQQVSTAYSTITTATAIGDVDGCAQDFTNTFRNDSERIYLVVYAQNVLAGSTYYTRWFYETQFRVQSVNWTPNQNYDLVCFWFYISPIDTSFTPGGWSVLLLANGEAVGASAFEILDG